MITRHVLHRLSDGSEPALDQEPGPVDPPHPWVLTTYLEAVPGQGAYQADIELTEDEFIAIDEAIAAIEVCGRSFSFDLLVRNHLDFLSMAEFVTTTVGLGRRFATPDRMAFARSVMGTMVNWLTAMRLYLDHTETTLKRRYGKDSVPAGRFTAVTRAAFDAHVGYRFCTKLRNYVLHCGLPLSQMQGEAIEPGRGRVRLLLDRDDLLDDYDGWGRVRADIEAMDASFDPVPLVEDAMAGLEEVHGIVLRLALEEAVARCGALVTALDRIDAAGLDGTPTLLLYEDTGTRDELQFARRSFDRSTVQSLADVANGARTMESLITPPTPPSSVLAPPRVREQLHADTRGVQIMGAYYAFDGPDREAEIGRVVGDLIRADGNAWPVIAGLINMNAVLGAMAAAGMGRSAQGLVAGLANGYRGPDE